MTSKQIHKLTCTYCGKEYDVSRLFKTDDNCWVCPNCSKANRFDDDTLPDGSQLIPLHRPMTCPVCGYTQHHGIVKVKDLHWQCSECDSWSPTSTPPESKQRKEEPGTKHDAEKLRYDLIPTYPLMMLAAVYTFGAQKYDDRNWEKGISHSRIIAAIERHVQAHKAGNYLDEETALPHLAHAAWGCLALMEYYRTGKGERDLPPCPFEDSLQGVRDILFKEE